MFTQPKPARSSAHLWCTSDLLEGATAIGCSFLGVEPDASGNQCRVFTFATPGISERFEIPLARPFPLSRLRDLVSDALRKHAGEAAVG